MIPRNPPPPRHRSSLTNHLAPASMDRVPTESDSDRTASMVRESNETADDEALTVTGKSPAGILCVEQRPIGDYVAIFERLLAETMDSHAPGFDDAVDNLVAWVSQEESMKVEALERNRKQMDDLKKENHELHQDINELLTQQNGDSQMEVEKLHAEAEEYKSVIDQMERDLRDRLAENSKLMETIENLKNQKSTPKKDEEENSSSSPLSTFKFANSFAKEAELSEQLLRLDIMTVNKGDALTVNWTEGFQATVNKDRSNLSHHPWDSYDERLHNSGLSVLHISALIGSCEMLKFWLSEDLDCCSADSRGNTILHWCLMAPHMRNVGLGFTGEDELTMIVTVCDFLRETNNLNSLLRLIFRKNRSGLAFINELGLISEGLIQPIIIPIKNYFSEALQYITTHQSGGGRGGGGGRHPSGGGGGGGGGGDGHSSGGTTSSDYDWPTYRLILQQANFNIPDNDTSNGFKLLINHDQKKDNLISYRVTKPQLRFGDESIINYSLLGCDQIGYLRHPDYLKRIMTFSQENESTSLTRLGFSTIGNILNFHPTLERQWAHIVIIGDFLYIHAESSLMRKNEERQQVVGGGGQQQPPPPLPQPIPITQMECHSLRRLQLLHLMEGYESMILMKFTKSNDGGEVEVEDVCYDLIIETEYKPQFILAVCCHYYTFCKPNIPSNYTTGQIIVSAPPIKVDINYYNAIPIYDSESTPLAIIVMTRFPHSNILGESMIVSCRSSSVTVPRFLSDFKKIATVSYIANLQDAIANSKHGDDSSMCSIENIGQSALCILHQNMLLELFATPLDEAECALFRLDLNMNSSFIRAIPFDSDHDQNESTTQTVANVTSALFTHISKLLDLTQITAETWYAIKFQEPKDESNTAVAAIGFGIKEERDDWMCLLYS